MSGGTMHADTSTSRRTSELGASAVEYALLVGLIAVVIFATITAAGLGVGSLYDDSCSQVAHAIDHSSC